jgi:HEPN domain-containing protein
MALSKKEHLVYWIETAQRDWHTSQNLFKTKEYVPSLFFAHLHLEKLCKALWVKNNEGNAPPRIHNLVILLDGANVRYSQDQLDFMIIMNNFQLEGRYPDYKQRLYKNYKKENTNDVLKQVKQFSQWLQRQL